MSNNGWIKYSEDKPKCHGKYLVTYAQYTEILMYVTQNDICEYNVLDCQINKLNQAWLEEADPEKAAIISKERSALCEKQDSSYISTFLGDALDFKEEGFYNWYADENGFVSWRKIDVTYWQPLPELPTE